MTKQLSTEQVLLKMQLSSSPYGKASGLKVGILPSLRQTLLYSPCWRFIPSPMHRFCVYFALVCLASETRLQRMITTWELRSRKFAALLQTRKSVARWGRKQRGHWYCGSPPPPAAPSLIFVINLGESPVSFSDFYSVLMRKQFNGRISAFQAHDPGSIPGFRSKCRMILVFIDQPAPNKGAV